MVERASAVVLLVFGAHAQPFPSTKCLVPRPHLYEAAYQSRTNDSITVTMPAVTRNDGCRDVSVATVEYQLYYLPYNAGDFLECDETCVRLTTFDRLFTVTGLRPFSKYIFCVSVRNFYSDLQDSDLVIGPAIVFQTAAGAPSKPQNVTVTLLNPTMVEISWFPPEELNGETIWYEVHWQTETAVHGVRQKGEQHYTDPNPPDSKKTADLQNLSPNQTYLIWVRAYAENNDTYTDSDPIEAETYPEPSGIRLVESTASRLVVGWNVSRVVDACVLQYADVVSSEWTNVTSQEADGVLQAVLGGLKPKMRYKFRLALKYHEYPELYIWPSSTKFVFETLGDKPSPPGMPVISHVKGDVYQISWEASRDNGAPVEMYNLESMSFRNYRMKRNTNRTAWFYNAPRVEEQDFEWVSSYNGTDTYWIISGLDIQYRYSFRVLALNAYGWSEPSEESAQFDVSAAATLAERHEQLGVILGISIPLLVTICICFIICFIYLIRCRNRNKKAALAMLANRPLSPDVELATLRELPRRHNFIHNTNALYVSAIPSPEELALLPQINRDQITLINFLGRGAFGEVYEGKAKRFGTNGVDMKVAVKTLRKGATEQEKIEFLQEAQLMSHFKHKHILQLLGVCLDTHFIIMELMEGGDLLTYLRSNRKPQSSRESLRILDLLSMCVDVSRGCRYLEEMHFVHRDLACRNCLVSSTDRQSRLVKIGDFGLARDIYKNDYYRKEGEGLLPVRWMAPESLVDGVFTCQSDVWAFGVLMWEIMTLGQQPYPARNNLEVLHYVKGGGRLEKPCHSSDELHSLMMVCWSYQPENRPTFKYCLEILEQLHGSTADGPLTDNYISSVSTVPNGVSNYAYFQDENASSGASSWKTDSGQDTPLVRSDNYNSISNNSTALCTDTSMETPKYLEIICDESIQLPLNDGYEIPRSSTRSRKSIQDAPTPSVGDDTKLNDKLCSFNSLTTQPLLNSLTMDDCSCDSVVNANSHCAQTIC